MLFNSIEFAFFLPIVFAIFWIFKEKVKIQNIILLIASYVFYGWWDYRFLSLIALSSFVDYIIGVSLEKEVVVLKRKLLLIVSITVNIGALLFFKYYNFFIDSFIDAYTLFGKPFTVNRLNIILPVGISFYTFQTLSYSIDVYKRKMRATSDIIAFFSYVSFFPQLVAGPIERASNLLPQFYTPRKFEYSKAVDGLRQLLGGFFKKMVIADNCAAIVNDIYNNLGNHSGGSIAIATVLFTFQIYGDFSGYSDIAIGTARLFGFDLMKNFNFPYFSRDIAEFWRRWHISLTTWFRDYIYIPLGGSRGGTLQRIRNTFIIFLVSGFWHGANWTFIFWGFLNAVLFLPLLLSKKNRKNIEIVAGNRLIPSFSEFIKVISTFLLVCFTWLFFRANSMHDAGVMIKKIFSSSLFVQTYDFKVQTFVFIAFFVVIEWINKSRNYSFDFEYFKVRPVFRYAIYICLIFCVFWFGGIEQEFIYFQF